MSLAPRLQRRGNRTPRAWEMPHADSEASVPWKSPTRNQKPPGPETPRSLKRKHNTSCPGPMPYPATTPKPGPASSHWQSESVWLGPFTKLASKRALSVLKHCANLVPSRSHSQACCFSSTRFFGSAWRWSSCTTPEPTKKKWTVRPQEASPGLSSSLIALHSDSLDNMEM